MNFERYMSIDVCLKLVLCQEFFFVKAPGLGPGSDITRAVLCGTPLRSVLNATVESILSSKWLWSDDNLSVETDKLPGGRLGIDSKDEVVWQPSEKSPIG